MNFFYNPYLTKNTNVCELNDDEFLHCFKVLRLKENSVVKLTNGNGIIFTGKIYEVNKKNCKIRILNYEECQKKYLINIGIALPKNHERFEWFLEKSTELGVDVITPLICERSERKEIRYDRCEKIIISAVKQAELAFKPKLEKILPFDDFILQKEKNNFKLLIAYCNEKNNKIKNFVNPGDSVVIIIGPEGDFSNIEINNAKKAGYIPVTLGKNKLRIETAGIVACQIINFLND